MNILVISNMYPSKQMPYVGLFVVNQINEIKSKLSENDSLEFYYMERTFTNPIGSILKYFKFFFRFVLLILKSKKVFDVVHVHYYYPTIYLALFYKWVKNKNCRIVVTFHGSDYYLPKKGFFYKYPFKKISHIIAVSDGLSASVKPYFSGEISTISAGISTIFKPEGEVQQADYDVIFVGSFMEIKGFDLFCEAIAQCDPSLRFCIVGNGPLESLVTTIRKTHSIDLFNGLSQEEIKNKLHRSKFLINTSRNESFGLSMTEAMACGVPVIATMTDGSMQQIKDQHNGFFIQDKNANSISESLKKIVEMDKESYKQMSENAIASAEKHKLNFIGNKIIEIYKQLIQTKN